MFVHRANAVPGRDPAKFAWAGLRRFHHVPTVVDLLQRYHALGKDDLDNARKQASQIRFCLIQAREYSDAAAATTLATRPVMLYYSLMSLAIAEILLKGTGKDSIDSARAEHAHHGLTLSVSKVAASVHDISSTAAALVAKPNLVSNRRGTFELWHKYAREDPLVGSRKSITAGAGGVEQPVAALMFGDNSRLGELPSAGMSLLTALRSLPTMYEWMPQSTSAHSLVVRGRVTLVQSVIDQTEELKFVIHPHFSASAIASIRDNILFSPDLINGKFRFEELASGFILAVEYGEGSPYNSSIPFASSIEDGEVRFLPVGSVLNEFGYFYIASHILSNYARYYPDLWMKDIEKGSPLAIAAEELLGWMEQRVPLLTYSQFSETYWVPRS